MSITSEKDMNILETQFKQREFDGKWERMVLIMDDENSYSYKTETGSTVYQIPTKWVTVGVYDYLADLEE